MPEAARERSVTLNPKIVQSNKIAAGDTLQLNLFPDANYSAKVDRVSKDINNTTTIRGRINGNPLSYVLINFNGNQSLINIEVPEQKHHFIIQKTPAGGNDLLDLGDTVSNALQDKPNLSPPKEKAGPSQNNNLANDPSDPITVDVMLAYTTAARVWADDSGSGINNIIAAAMGRAQLTNDNSNTNLTFRLVHSFETNYVESGDSGTDLMRLTNPADGYMDNINTLRTQYGADLVSLLADVQDTGGIAWLMENPAGDPDYAFSLVRVEQTGWTYTLVHEMGHNMGAGHSAIQNFQPGPGIFSYSSGWRWIGNNGGKYCSVMTYEAGYYYADGQTHTAVGYWSNPSVTYQGVATGDAVNGDNARTIRETKAPVASYYNADAITPAISISAPSSATTYNTPVTYTITYTGAETITLANANVTLNKTLTADGTVTVSGSGTDTRTVTISAITGSGTLGISIAAATATNVPGNAAPAAGPSATFDVVIPILNLIPDDFSVGWNMTAFPDLSAGLTANTLLPGTYKTRRYDGNSNSYIKAENSDIALTPGQGYWIKVDDVNSIVGRSYLMSQVNSVEIPVTYGWNLLGDPYQTNMPLSNLVVKFTNGTTTSYADAINQKKVSGYAWSWNQATRQYLFIAINPNNYQTDAPKQTVVTPYRGFWMIVKSADVASIILNR